MRTPPVPVGAPGARPVLAFAAALVLSAPAVFGAGDPSGGAADAFLKYQRGDLVGAESAWRKLSAEPATRAEAVVGLADVYLASGRYDEARSLLEPAAREFPKAAAVSAKLGELYDTLGLYPEAAAAFKAAKDADPDNVAARFGAAGVALTLGRRDDAMADLEWFERFSKKGVDPKTPVDMVIAGRALDRLAVETGRRSRYSKFVLNELYIKAEQTDKLCWQSRLAQGEILAARYNFPQAVKEFQAALKINPKAAQAYVALADMALDQWNFEAVEKNIDEALKINPRHVGALAMRSALKLQERRHAEALAAADEALKVNPNHPTALGLAAAAAKLIPDMPKYEQYLSRARAVNPDPAETYLVIGAKLAGERQFDEAQEMFGLVLKAAPKNSDAWTARGMAYMQTGHEKEALETLEESYRMDSYNARVFNTLTLLDKLKKWSKDDIVTEHFIIRYSRAEDAVVGRMFADFCEQIYPDLTDLFAHKPKVKTLIEILPEHQQFGVRLTGLPQIHTVGACTGNVIAMDTPSTRPMGSPLPFNWAQVLKHEYTHTLTLSATENRIAHWFTEGLAVWSERRQRSWNWQTMLVQQLQNDDLFKLQDINWGFIRPRRRDRDDRQLAYAQGEWMCQYIEHRWGRKALLDMLEGYRLRKKQAQVFREITGLDEDAFFKEFCDWARKDVEKWGFRILPKPRKIDDLLVLLSADPLDPELLVELSRAQFNGRDAKDMDGALKTARKAAARWPAHPLVLDRLARLLSNARSKEAREEAAALWQKVYDLDPANWVAAEQVGNAAQQKREYPKAVAAYERLVKLVPGHPGGWRGLAAIYRLADKPDKVAEALRKVQPLEESDAKIPQWLAEYHADRDEHEQAILRYREVLHVDPFNVDAHVSIGDLALKVEDWPAERRGKTALDAYANALEVRMLENEQRRKRGRTPDLSAEALVHLRIAKAHRRLGRPAEARTSAEAALKLDPECGAKEFLEDLK